jgi:hypothetical protein
MKNEHTLPDKIAKLPQWAQQHIKELVRQREAAVVALQRFTDEATPAPFFTEELVCETKGSPTRRRRYVHAHRIMLEHKGLDLNVSIGDYGVSIQYGQRRGIYDILMQPTSFQQFMLRYPESGK